MPNLNPMYTSEAPEDLRRYIAGCPMMNVIIDDDVDEEDYDWETEVLLGSSFLSGGDLVYLGKSEQIPDPPFKLYVMPEEKFDKWDPLL